MDLSPDQLYVEGTLSPEEIELNRAIMASLRPSSPNPLLTVSPPMYQDPYQRYDTVAVPSTRPLTMPVTPAPFATPATRPITAPVTPAPFATPVTRPLTRPLTMPVTPQGQAQCMTPPVRLPTVPYPTAPVFTPGRETVVTSPKGDEDAEEDMLAAAIALSMEAAEHARNAINYTELEYTAPRTEYVSPRTEAQLIRAEQDYAYQAALRADRAREEAIQQAAEEARLAGIAAEKAARMVQDAREMEHAKHEALRPPLLRYSIEVGSKDDIFTLRFRLYDGSVVTHSFNRREPIASLFQQLRFDLRDLGELKLTMQPRKLVNCDLETGIEDCGITDRSIIIVERV